MLRWFRPREQLFQPRAVANIRSLPGPYTFRHRVVGSTTKILGRGWKYRCSLTTKRSTECLSSRRGWLPIRPLNSRLRFLYLGILSWGRHDSLTDTLYTFSHVTDRGPICIRVKRRRDAATNTLYTFSHVTTKDPRP